jgi:hypothetical protein
MEIPRWWIEHISFWSLFISLTVGVCLFLFFSLSTSYTHSVGSWWSVLVSWRDTFPLFEHFRSLLFFYSSLFLISTNLIMDGFMKSYD